MRQPSPEPAAARALLPRTANFALVCGLLWQGWQLYANSKAETADPAAETTPAPMLSAAATGPATQATEVAQANLFGALRSRSTANASVPLILTGTVMSSKQGGGFAIIGETRTETRLYKQGTEIVPGIKLLAVYRDHVEVDRDGARETVGMHALARASYTAIVLPAQQPGDEVAAAEDTTIIIEDQGIREETQVAMLSE